MIDFLINNLLSTYKVVFSIVGFVASLFLFRAAIVNLGNVSKRRYSKYGAGMCVFMLIMGVIIAALSGYFIAM